MGLVCQSYVEVPEAHLEVSISEAFLHSLSASSSSWAFHQSLRAATLPSEAFPPGATLPSEAFPNSFEVPSAIRG